MLSLDRRRFLFVTGKGGSGKTTVSAALALTLAARGQRVLVATSGARERLSALLDSAPLGAEITALRPNLWGVLLTPEVALREYGTMVLQSPKLVRALFDNRYVQGFFNGAPGLRQWALLGKAWYHTQEKRPDGSPRFDVVVFDAPATGHGLDMLRVPKVILAAAPPGRLRTDAERALGFLRDPAKSGVVVVTLPEEMPTNETLELITALTVELGLPVAEIVANSVVESLFSEAESEALAGLAELDVTSRADAALGGAARRALAERAQRESLARLLATNISVRQLPRVETGEITRSDVEALGAHFR
jgi:anion-transporting  ArsA/GET3 family ATPase